MRIQVQGKTVKLKVWDSVKMSEDQARDLVQSAVDNVLRDYQRTRQAEYAMTSSGDTMAIATIDSHGILDVRLLTIQRHAIVEISS